MTDLNEILSTIPEVPAAMRLDYETLTEAMALFSDFSFKYASLLIKSQLFRGDILPHQVSVVTGSGPFPEEEFRDFLDRAGVLLDEDIATNEILNEFEAFIVVVGREDFDTEELDEWLYYYAEEDPMPNFCEFMSQEDFLNRWLFGLQAPYYDGDPRINQHPGLAYLAHHEEYMWPWPSTTVKPGSGTLTDIGWREYHELRERFGYTVNAKDNLSDQQRQRILDRALTTLDQPLDLYTVVHHLAFLIKNRKWIDEDKFANAIAKWERDLAYLKQKYYKQQFVWPK